MKIPSNAGIPMEKLTRYLLVPRMRDDKSGFLSQAGSNLNILLPAIRNHADAQETFPDDNEYGEFFRVEDGLRGP